jgi:hypothetical protein
LAKKTFSAPIPSIPEKEGITPGFLNKDPIKSSWVSHKINKIKGAKPM